MQHTTITVNNLAWSILFCPPSSTDLMRSDGTIALGVTDHDLLTVFLSSALHGELLYKVLCHELCHVYIFSYGYYMDVEEEERLAQFLSEYGQEIIGDTDLILARFTTPISLVKNLI